VDDLRTATRNLYARDWRKPIQKGKVKIKTKDMRLIPLVPNEVQTRLMAHIWDMEQQGKPVRLMIPKARQHHIHTYRSHHLLQNSVHAKHKCHYRSG